MPTGVLSAGRVACIFYRGRLVIGRMSRSRRGAAARAITAHGANVSEPDFLVHTEFWLLTPGRPLLEGRIQPVARSFPFRYPAGHCPDCASLRGPLARMFGTSSVNDKGGYARNASASSAPKTRRRLDRCGRLAYRWNPPCDEARISLPKPFADISGGPTSGRLNRGQSGARVRPSISTASAGASGCRAGSSTRLPSRRRCQTAVDEFDRTGHRTGRGGCRIEPTFGAGRGGRAPPIRLVPSQPPAWARSRANRGHAGIIGPTAGRILCE